MKTVGPGALKADLRILAALSVRTGVPALVDCLSVLVMLLVLGPILARASLEVLLWKSSLEIGFLIFVCFLEFGFRVCPPSFVFGECGWEDLGG